MGFNIHITDRQVRPLAQLLHPLGAGFQRPHEPPTPSGHDAAAVVAGSSAVTVTVRVLVLLGVVDGGLLVTVTRSVDVLQGISLRGSKISSLERYMICLEAAGYLHQTAAR
jgi:hypothetical protein